MLYTYKLPNGVLRLSDKAEYFADASDAYHSLAKVQHLHLPLRLSCTPFFMLWQPSCALPDSLAILFASCKGTVSKQLQKTGSLSPAP